MSVFITTKSAPYYWYSFQIQRRRFFGSTRCTNEKDAKRFEALERDKAKALIKATKRSATSLALDDVAARLWIDQAQHDADPDATETNIARLVDYFGKTMLLTDINHGKAKAMVAWRRGHHITRRGKLTKEQREALPLIAPATVNRSTTKVLQRLFTFAKAEGAAFENEPKWEELLLEEPVERIRELHDGEADTIDANMRDDYGAFFAFVMASGLRLKECVTLKWSEVNFGTKQIVRTGKGGRRIVVNFCDAIREILFPLQGNHPEFVFTYVAIYGNKRLGIERGKRYPITYNGTKSAWQAIRRNAGLKDFRFHDFRHDFGTKLLRDSKNLKLVRQALNHADIKSTLRYAHVLGGEIADAIDRVARNRKSLGKSLGQSIKKVV
jgi:integrase